MTDFRPREILTYGWFASLGLLLLLLIGVTWRYTIPSAQRLRLGNRTEFTVGTPHLRQLSDTVAVYVVHLDGHFYAWDTEPAVPKPCARLQWNAEFNRFEDPCSGAG